MVKKSYKDIIKQYNLQPLAVEGGFYINKEGDESFSSIYYLITEESYSAMHRLKNNEIWTFVDGDPCSQLQISSEQDFKEIEIGCANEGYKSYSIVYNNHWQGTKLIEGGKWALFFIAVVPSFDNSCFEIINEKNIKELNNIKEIEKYLPRNNKCML